jgi:hypothetical protein
MEKPKEKDTTKNLLLKAHRCASTPTPASAVSRSVWYCPYQLPDPSPYEGGSVGVLVFKTPVKAGCLAAVKTAQEGASRSPQL